MSTASTNRESKTGFIAAVLVLGLVLGSCSFTSTKDYRIEWAALRSRLNIHEVTVDWLEAYRGLSQTNNADAMQYTMRAVAGFSYVCYGQGSYRESIKCTMRMVRNNITLDGRSESFWNMWHDAYNSSKVTDYEEAFRHAAYGNDRCLVSDFPNHASGDNNWTWRRIGESECRRGG